MNGTESLTLQFRRFYLHEFKEYDSGDSIHLIQPIVETKILQREFIFVSENFLQFVNCNPRYKNRYDREYNRELQHETFDIIFTVGDSFTWTNQFSSGRYQSTLLEIDPKSKKIKFIDSRGELINDGFYGLVGSCETHAKLHEFVMRGFPMLGQTIVNEYVKRVGSIGYEFALNQE